MLKNKTVLIIAVLVIVLGILVFFYYKNNLKPVSPQENMEEEIIPPEATGDINDLTDALEKEMIDEMNTIYEEDEANLIISDTEAIDSFGQTADDVEL